MTTVTAAPDRGVFGALDDRTVEILERRRRGSLPRRGWLVRRALLIADLAGLVGAFAVSQELFGRHPVHDRIGPSLETLLFLASLPVWFVAARAYGLYDHDEERTDHTTAEDLSGVFHLLTVGSWLLFAVVWLAPVASPQVPKQLSFWAIGICAVSTFRVIARALCRRNIAYIQNTVIVGSGPVGQLVARKLLQHHEYGLNLVGFVDEAPKDRRAGLEHLKVLSGVTELPEVVERLDIDRVIFTFSNTSSRELVGLVRRLRERDVQIDVVPRMFEVTGLAVDVHDIEGLPLMALRSTRSSRPSRYAKRILDVVVASLALILTAPLFGWIAWRVRRSSPGPIFFRQSRLGEGRREFTFLKFRTMRVDTDPSVHEAYIRRSLTEDLDPEANGLFKLDQGDKITPVGRFLRRTSLDELPQLINVLRGDMSLVGPRPCIPYETENFEPHHFERFDVPAGITGLWQVSARGHSTFREALDMDVTYARNWSLALDFRLLLRTPLQLLRPRGTE